DEAKGQQHPENLRCGVPAFSELADLRHGYTRPTKEKPSRDRRSAHRPRERNQAALRYSRIAIRNDSRPRSSAAAKPMNRRPCWPSAAAGLRSALSRKLPKTLPTPMAAIPAPIAARPAPMSEAA